MYKYDTIICIDKLIIGYIIESNIKFDQNYLQKFYNPIYSNYMLPNDIVLNESESDSERTLKCLKRLTVFRKEVKLGKIYYENIDNSYFYFKFDKKILVEKTFLINHILNIIKKLFTFKYKFNNITRLEIAADTTGLSGKNLFVIQDLCAANSYFSNLRETYSQSISTFGGRSFEDCKYQTYGKLKISINEKGVVHIGCPTNWKHVKSYNKSEFSEGFQKDRFIEKFGTSDNIYRLEVSLNNEGCKRENINLYHLDNNDYLTYLFKKSAFDYLTFKDLKSKTKNINGNKVFDKIQLVKDMKFEFAGNSSDNSIYDSDNKVNTNKSENNTIKSNRSKLSKLIRKYYQSQENIDEILSFIANNRLSYFENFTLLSNVDQALIQINTVAQRMDTYLPNSKTVLVDVIRNLSDTSARIEVKKNIVTTTKKYLNGKIFGFTLSRCENLF